MSNSSQTENILPAAIMLFFNKNIQLYRTQCQKDCKITYKNSPPDLKGKANMKFQTSVQIVAVKFKQSKQTATKANVQ